MLIGKLPESSISCSATGDAKRVPSSGSRLGAHETPRRVPGRRRTVTGILKPATAARRRNDPRRAPRGLRFSAARSLRRSRAWRASRLRTAPRSLPLAAEADADAAEPGTQPGVTGTATVRARSIAPSTPRRTIPVVRPPRTCLCCSLTEPPPCVPAPLSPTCWRCRGPRTRSCVLVPTVLQTAAHRESCASRPTSPIVAPIRRLWHPWSQVHPKG